MCSSEVGDDVPKRKPMVQRSKTMSLDMFKISDKASVFCSISLVLQLNITTLSKFSGSDDEFE